MEIDLACTDYIIVGLTFPNTLKSFQSVETKQRTKIAVGDQDGVLQVFSLKNDEIQMNFKTLPGEPIAALDIGISQGGCYDKIFIATNTEVKGYSKKGKLFMSLETNLSEPIVAMKVFEADLLVTGAHCMAHYRDCKEIGSYICGDSIVDIGAIQLQNSNRVIGIIACRGGAVHAIERGRVLAVIKLPMGPGILFPAASHVNTDYIYYGANDGSLYTLTLDREHGSLEAHSHMDVEKISGISAVGWWENSNIVSTPLLLLGYSNGRLQIYSLKTESARQTSQLIFTYNFDESLTSVTGWNKGIVVATRSGRIMGLTTPMDAQTTASKMNKLKEEILLLEHRVEKERSQYRIATQPLSQGLSAIPTLKINDEWGPIEADGAKKLCISLGAPLDIILVQSNAPLQLLDTCPNTALLTRAINMKGANKLLATYRCQANTQQLEMKIGIWTESTETTGKLNIYVTPLLQPKCCQILKYHISPLFWHVQIENVDDDAEYNTLTITGPVSKAEIHAWLNFLLAEVPSATQTTINYKSVITDTVLVCNYRKGEIVFKSNNVSTICVIKDFLSAEAMKKKIKLDMSCVVNNSTTLQVLEKLQPKLSARYEIIKKEKLMNALSELQTNNESFENNICEEYADMMSKTKNKTNDDCLQLDQLYDIVKNLFIDTYKLKGYNAKYKIHELKELLDRCDYENVTSFFENNLVLN